MPPSDRYPAGMRTLLAALAFVVIAKGAMAQGQRQREALNLLIETSAYSQACVPFDVFRQWKLDWKMLERVLTASGISFEDLDNPGVSQQRANLEALINEKGQKACDAYITRYGPNGSVIPNLMYPNTDKPINVGPVR